MTNENREKIITDINEDLVRGLDADRKAFYSELEGKKKDYFLFMSQDDQATLMRGGLDAQEEELMWKHGSTLALNIINKGFGLTERARAIGKVGRISLILAVLIGISGLFTSTYLKNHKIQSLLPASDSVATSTTSKLAINTTQNELIRADRLMTPADFLISWRSSCSPLGDLSDSFYQSSGKPFCKQDGDKTWVAGYVHVDGSYGDQAQPVFLKEEGGKLINIDFVQGLKSPFQGVQSVSLDNVEKEIRAAFNKNNQGEKHE